MYICTWSKPLEDLPHEVVLVMCAYPACRTVRSIDSDCPGQSAWYCACLGIINIFRMIALRSSA